MVHSNKKRLISNLDNVVKTLPSERKFYVFRKLHDDFSNSRTDLNQIFLGLSVDIFTLCISRYIFKYLNYNNKRKIFQVRSGFDFSREKEFRIINKYSALNCPTHYWYTFPIELLDYFQKNVETFFNPRCLAVVFLGSFLQFS